MIRNVSVGRRPSGSFEYVLRLAHLTGGYRSFVAFEDVSFELYPGEIVSLIGPNGAGKSALLKCIAGILPPFSGRIEWGKEITLGYLPQGVKMDRSLPIKVREFLSLRLAPQAFSLFQPLAFDDRWKQSLEKLGVGYLAERTLNELSGGELQLVLLASVLAKRPGLLLLDEPFSGMGPGSQKDLGEVLAQLREEEGVATLLVSHDLHLVHHISDRIYCLNRTLCCQGTPSEVLKEDNLAKVYGRRIGALG
ncbi:metal ABC transporter ATP-binding protein [Candidatus Methylacidithermus pantelleriae]|uniref:Zn(2(+)) ABC transporter ATP binding subunit n=1 Tax=Candidatus Methylacidithermus pantelleriae TaxID=2744239 RepID=A0A8J2BGL4_9BACT|nr:metal ABC transporter ATP-binding protein [Candidatus Methylacidithermus pantelleriae]CAF0691928.1 Zn(2(+)) ABC transporter ATP binding subunit [Candidatus Methylacidithermus pantelleriae]